MFPYEPAKLDKLLQEGDEKIKKESYLGFEWLKETNFARPWEDVKFLRDNWSGPLILKGIQSAQVSANACKEIYQSAKVGSVHSIDIASFPFVTCITDIS